MGICGRTDLASEALKSDVLLEGQSNLFNHRELSGSVVDIMELLRKGEPLTKLIASGDKDGLNVKIGTENEYKQLSNSSVIISRYDVNGSRSGALGIIGPTRLDYAKLIPRIEYLTELVSKMLTETFEDK